MKFRWWYSLIIFLAIGLYFGLNRSIRLGFQELLYPFERSSLWLREAAGVRLSAAWQGLIYGTSNEEALHEVDRLRVLISEMSRKALLAQEVLAREAWVAGQEGPLVMAPVWSHGGGLGLWPQLLLGKGSKDGIQEGDVVIAPEGLVGRIGADVSLHTSQVILLSDPGCRVAAEVPGLTRGIVAGMRGEDLGEGVMEDALYRCFPLRLKFVRKEVALLPRQQVFTEGSGGLFPRGLLIGTLATAEPVIEGALEQSFAVEPAVDPTALSVVFVMTKGTVKNVP